MLEEFNPNSSQMLSKLFFGGEIKIKEKVPEVNEFGIEQRVKSGPNKGNLKYKSIEKTLRIDGYKIKPLEKWKQKKEGIYSTNDDVLQVISKKEKSNASRLASLILQARNLKKQISTYYSDEFLYPTDYVHASFNHCGTATKRLSSNKPNIQNQPDSSESKVKEHFISRYKDGVLISADYSQIEIAVQAQISNDFKYIQDVINKVDFHIKRLALKEGISYFEAYKKIKEDEDPVWIHKRKLVKGFSFARAYGAGVKKIAEQTGLTQDEIKTLIEKEDEEYPQLKLFYDKLNQEVKAFGFYRGFTGAKYSFIKYPATRQWQLDQGISESYSPTEIKNYIVQGSMADIVLIMFGKFWREKALFNRDKYVLINTIHDSLMLDCKSEYVSQAKEDLKDLELVKPMCKQLFNYEFKVPISIDISTGTSWFYL